MPAADAQPVRVLTQRAVRSPPHPAWRHAVVEDVHRWGTLSSPRGISTERHRTSTHVPASQPFIAHPCLSLHGREGPTAHGHPECSDAKSVCMP